MKERFEPTIVFLDAENVMGYQFPEVFSNEIYYSDQSIENQQFNIGYVSPFTIKYTISGYEKYLVNGKEKIIDSNKLIIINNESHVVNTTSYGKAFSIFIDQQTLKNCHEGLLLFSQYEFVEPLDTRYWVTEFCDEICAPGKHLTAFINRLLHKTHYNRNAVLTSDFYYELAERVLVSQNEKLRAAQQLDCIKLSTRLEVFKRVQRAREFIEDVVCESFDLDILSKVSCMSKYNLIRSFKKVYHITPHRYFLTRKIDKAKQLLKYDKSAHINEISVALGYSDVFTFSKQFKAISGYNPSTFRQRFSN